MKIQIDSPPKMSKPPPRFLFFDLGNVLVNFDHGRLVSRLATLLNVENDDVRQFVFESGLQPEYESGRIDTGQFCERIRGHFDTQATDRQIRLACSDIFWPNPSIFPLVTALRSANCAIGILSNTCHAHWTHLQESVSNLLNLFPVRILSYEEGCVKPDPDIYLRAIAVAGVPANQVFFVDDLARNVQAAIAAGMDSVQYLSTRQLARELRARNVPFSL